MNIKRAKQEICDAIEAYLLKDEDGAYVIPTVRQRPILLLGAPGIGKTQIMEQAARECSVGLVAYTITHHTRQSAIGLPFIAEKEFGGEKKAVTEYTMSEIVASVYEKMEKTGLKEGILFIDEINCVSETLAPAMLQFLQCKTFGNHPIPEGWIIVAAGNPPEYNRSVREFDVVTLDRVKLIEVEPDYTVWREYAQETHIHPAILAYLDARESHFYQMENTIDGRRFATPRGWEDLSRMIEVYEKLGKPVDAEVVRQYLQHDRIAAEFANYLELYHKYESDYGIPEILSGTIRETVLKRLAHAPFDERLSVVKLLLSGVLRQLEETREQELFTELLYEQLKQIRTRFEQKPLGGPEACRLLAEQREQAEAEREQKKRGELLTRQEDRRLRRLVSTMLGYEAELKRQPPADGEEAFDILRGLFLEERTAYEDLQEAGSTVLEHAFDFLEAAFEPGQEMVVFLTGLHTSSAAIAFLAGTECERCDRYNRELLLG